MCLHCLATQHILLVQQVRCARPCDGEMPSNHQPPGRVSVWALFLAAVRERCWRALYFLRVRLIQGRCG